MIFKYWLMLAWLIIMCLHLACCQSPFYDVPSYFGHFSLNFFLPEALQSARLTKLEYHFAIDASYDNSTVFFAMESQHCVYQYNRTTQVIKTIIGVCGLSGNSIGLASSALLNGVSSLAYYQQPSDAVLASIQQERPVWVANASCSIATDSSCLLPNAPQAPTIGNLRLYPEIPLFPRSDSLYTSPEYLYVADTNNHCIKRLALSSMLVDVVAGNCGSAGFKDGPLGYNRLNLPRNMGVSRLGVVYFFDSGNEYIRIINKSGEVQTLLLGACKEYGLSRTIEGYSLRQIICYENWIELQTKNADPSQDHYFDPSILRICLEQESKCTI